MVYSKALVGLAAAATPSQRQLARELEYRELRELRGGPGGPGGPDAGGSGSAGVRAHGFASTQLSSTFVGGAHGLLLLAAGLHGANHANANATANATTLYVSDTYLNVPGAQRSGVYRLEAPYTGAPTAVGVWGSAVAGLLAVAMAPSPAVAAAAAADVPASSSSSSSSSSSFYAVDTDAGTVTTWTDMGDGKAATAGASWTVGGGPWNVAHVGGGGGGGGAEQLVAVSDDGTVWQLPAGGGAGRQLFGGLKYPYGIADGGNGSVWISEQVDAPPTPGFVRRRSLSDGGAILEQVGFAFANPEGLALADDGALLIADTGNGNIVRYDTATKAAAAIATGEDLAVNVAPGWDDAAGAFQLLVNTGYGNLWRTARS